MGGIFTNDGDASGDEPMVAINVTPLIDVMTCLLVAFMVAMPIASQEAVEIDLPHSVGEAITEEEFEYLVISIDATGRVFSKTDDTLAGPFNGIIELSQKLAQSRQVHDCVAAEWMRFGMGRGLMAGDACSLKQVQDKFMTSQGRFDDLLVAIIMSDTFRTRPAGVAR